MKWECHQRNCLKRDTNIEGSVTVQKSRGMMPERLLNSRYKSARLDSRPSESGMLPEILLFARCNHTRFDNSPSELGSVILPSYIPAQKKG